MTATARRRVLILGASWFLVPATAPAPVATGSHGTTGFFVALAAFANTLVGGLLPGPFLGPLAGRHASKEKRLVR